MKMILHECSCLVNLLNELSERDKMRDLPSIYLFCTEFSIFNNTGARMLDSIYHMPLKSHFSRENGKFLPHYVTLLNL